MRWRQPIRLPPYNAAPIHDNDSLLVVGYSILILIFAPGRISQCGMNTTGQFLDNIGLPHGWFGFALQHRVFGHRNDVLKVGF